MKDNLISCPFCFAQGQKQILCEVNTQGAILIERHHQSYTVIAGTSFQVSCGKCGNPIYIHEGTVNTDLSLNCLGSIAGSLV